MSEKKMMVLHCEAGNHEWERESRRGRPPINCPEHTVDKPVVIRQKQAVKASDTPAEISPIMRWLACEGDPERGIEAHMYQAESKRGRKPRFCPEHTPVIDPIERQRKSQQKSIEKKNEQERELILTQIPIMRERVKSTESEDDVAYDAYMKTKSDDDFKNWMRKNSILMGEVTALTAREAKLEVIGV